MTACACRRNLGATETYSPAYRQSDQQIFSLYEWRGGAYVGSPDSAILSAATKEKLTLVTCDRQTIPPVLIEWGATGVSHGGVVFVDNRAMASSDFGRLTRRLIYYWDREHESNWTNRIGFLPALPG